MKYNLLLLAGAAKLAFGTPVTSWKRDVNASSSTAPVVLPKPPANLYIEQDLDLKKAATPEAQIKIVNYGPYPIPANGMLEGKWGFYLEKPCEKCYITAMQADLVDETGRSVNIEEGAWLHHIVVYNGIGVTPGSKKDVVCSGSIYSLGLGYPNRIFASGNERAAVRINGKYKYGLKVDEGDAFHLLYDLVNQRNKPVTYFIKMIYEILPQTTPEYKEARMLWVDVTGCYNAEAKAQEGAYELKSPGWKADISGKFLFTLGHTHDGGVYTHLYVNDKPICRSEQLYGTKPAFYEKSDIVNVNSEDAPGDNHNDAGKGGEMEAHGHDQKMPSTINRETAAPEMWHLSEVSSCVDFGRLNLGDKVVAGAFYNTSQHKQNLAVRHNHAGWPWETPPKYAPIMGIHPVYIGLDDSFQV